MAVAPTLQSRIKVTEDVLYQELQGQAVLLNLKTGVYFGLDPVGTRVWQLLEQHSLLAKILEVIVSEYEVPEARCAEDLLALVANMEQHELVTLS
jgi:hypothetical protein